MKDDPYHDIKVRHLAKHVDQNGRVSPFCAKKHRAINMKQATWTTDKTAVTCNKCLNLMIIDIDVTAKNLNMCAKPEEPREQFKMRVRRAVRREIKQCQTQSLNWKG
jgi:hypothetical protein